MYIKDSNSQVRLTERVDPITILDTEYVTLWYYPEHKIVHHVIHKFIYGDNFRANLEEGLKIFQQYGAAKWLSDDRHNSVLMKEDIEWSGEDWFPRMYDAGWRYWAIVMPDKVVGQANMNRVMNTYVNRGLTVKIHDHSETALEWLKSV